LTDSIESLTIPLDFEWRKRMNTPKCRTGAALVISMFFVVVFSILALSITAMCGTNVRIADNQHKVGCAFGGAESGLHVSRYWLARVTMPSTTPTSAYFTTIVETFRDDLLANNISNLPLDSAGNIPCVPFDSDSGCVFDTAMAINANTPTVLEVCTTGRVGPVARTVKVNFNVEPYKHPIFNFGLATKGPLNFPGNPTFAGVTDNWEADIYIQSDSNATALQILGNCNFDGDINIANAAANADFQGDVIIAGDHGQTAIDNHVFIGVDPPDFPVPDTARFLQYATGDLVDDDTDLSKGITLTNAVIAAGTNPTFAGTVTVKGILYIQPPNEVTFGRNCMLEGIIVAPGDVNNPGSNSLTFNGNFDTAPYPQGQEFDAIRGEVGSSILAPGFSAYFGGNFSTVNGVIAVSGVHFAGNASAVVKGTIINYADTPTVVEGNTVLNFDRASSTPIPAGFDTLRVLDYDPSSYAIVH
jgi:hypothetical protein